MRDDCLKTRAALYPLDEPKPSLRETEVARAHLGECVDCQEFFRHEREFVAWLRPQLETEAAPPDLRQRISARLSRGQRTHSSRVRARRRSALALLAAGLGTAAAILVFFPRGPRPPGISEVERALVEDHIRYVARPGRAELATEEPGKAAQWFADKLHFRVRAPELPGGRLEGARLCFLFGSHVALLFYEVEGRPLSFFVLDGESVDLSAAHFEEVADKRLCLASRSGYHLALWEDAGLIYAMVSDVSADNLTLLAAGL